MFTRILKLHPACVLSPLASDECFCLFCENNFLPWDRNPYTVPFGVTGSPRVLFFLDRFACSSVHQLTKGTVQVRPSAERGSFASRQGCFMGQVAILY